MCENTENTDITILSENIQGIRFTSQLDTTTEILKDGRLLPVLRSHSGRPKYQLYNTWESSRWMEKYIGKNVVEAFQLQIDGQSLNSNWNFKDSYKIGESQESIKHCVMELEHSVRPIKVKIHTKIDGTPFYERWIEVTNTGDKSALLSEISPVSGILWLMKNYREHKQEDIYSLGYYTQSDFCYEGDFSWEPLRNGKFTIEGKNGRSGWGMPFFIVKNKINGEYFMCHLEWSANWMAEFSVEQEKSSEDALICLKVGPNSPSPMRVIAAGETIVSPIVHFGFDHGNYDTCIQHLHTHLRKSVLLPQTPGRNLLFGGGRVVEGGEEWLKNQIDIAYNMGMEYFMVDAAWYGVEPNDWWNTVGDWNVGDWIKNGFGPIREYIHSKGMLFGLWMEPEAIGENSNLFKQHPNWSHIRRGEPISKGRLLDLSKKEVEEWVEAQVFNVIESYKPDIFKIDFNCMDINQGGENIREGYVENALWGHVEALYRIFDKVKIKYPNLITENCAAGGGRNDLGMVRRFNISCQSDYTVLPRSLKALNNLTIAYPPEVFKYYYGHWGTYHHFGDYDFQIRVAILSNPIFVGFGDKSEDINQTEKEKLKHYLKIYSDFIRPILPKCWVYHHTPDLDSKRIHHWCVLQYSSEDLIKAVIGIFKLTCEGSNEYLVKPQGLKPDCKYQVTMDNLNYSQTLSGHELITTGINILLENALTSELLLIKKL